MDLVTRYRGELDALYKEVKPGASPPPPPATADGLLKVKPIREWALGKPAEDPSNYVVKQYEVGSAAKRRRALTAHTCR